MVGGDGETLRVGGYTQVILGPKKLEKRPLDKCQSELIFVRYRTPVPKRLWESLKKREEGLSRSRGWNEELRLKSHNKEEGRTFGGDEETPSTVDQDDEKAEVGRQRMIIRDPERRSKSPFTRTLSQKKK